MGMGKKATDGSVVFIFHTSTNSTTGVKSAPVLSHLFMVKVLGCDISCEKYVFIIFKYLLRDLIWF